MPKFKPCPWIRGKKSYLLREQKGDGGTIIMRGFRRLNPPLHNKYFCLDCFHEGKREPECCFQPDGTTPKPGNLGKHQIKHSKKNVGAAESQDKGGAGKGETHRAFLGAKKATIAASMPGPSNVWCRILL